MTKVPDGRSTRAIHGTSHLRTEHEPVVSPLYQSSTFVHQVGSSEEVWYTRYGNNPNQTRLAEKLMALEESEAAIFLASGMGATALAHMAVLRPGDHLLASEWIYGGTHKLFTEEFGKLGIEVTFVKPDNPRNWRQAGRKNTRAIFVETPTNPHIRVIDLAPIADLCHQQGIVLICDSTFASPINFRPLEHGADVVIHSATKYLNGHTDVIGGVVLGTDEIVQEVRRLMQLWGQSPDPAAAWLTERGLKTLAVRMARHNENGIAFANWAMEQEAIVAVHYPGLPEHPDHKTAARVMTGFGGMVGIVVKGGSAGAETMLRRLRLATHAPSLGGVETLVSEPRLTSHASFSAAQREAMGVPDGFVRVSLGIEDVEDIIADFATGLNAIGS